MMKVTLRNYQGKVLKKATVQSNDPLNPELIIKMAGTVQAIIDVKPSTNILFRGMPTSSPNPFWTWWDLPLFIFQAMRATSVTI